MTLFRLISACAVLGLATCPSPGLAPVPKGAGWPAPEVQVVGVYEGTSPPGVRHRAGFHPNGTVTVTVGAVKKPVILVLTSYEPVVWKIEAPKGAVVEVIASGHYKQTVEGLGEKVPVTLLSYKAGDTNFFYAYRKEAGPNDHNHERAETKRKYEQVIERVKELTKQDIKVFQGEYAGSTFEIK